jgi:c-di-GMP-binding flagellar brake protein YcgR
MNSESSTDENPENRRNQERLEAKIDVRFTKAADAARALNAFSVNFSAGGLCLRSKELHVIGETLALDLTIEGVRLELIGEVSWVRGEVLGVRFVDLHPKLREQLAHVAQSLASKKRT